MDRDDTPADDDDYHVDDLRQLELDRAHNDRKLKSRFEHIFRKYEHDFEGIGDEIEIASGDIVVDNGHLQHMRHEVDPGHNASASSQFVKNFADKLGDEDASSSEETDSVELEEDEDEGDDGEESSESDTPSEVPASSRYAQTSSRRHGHHTAPRKVANAFGDLARPAPRLAHFLVGRGETETPGLETARPVQEEESSVVSTSGTSTPHNILASLPSVQEAMMSLQPSARRLAADPDAIQALGVSIANQLAQLMAGGSKSKRKKKVQPTRKRATRQSLWDYPEIDPRPRKKQRHRSPSPVLPFVPPSAPGSPGQDSLWAPEGSVRSFGRPRPVDEADDSRSTPAGPSTSTNLLSSGNGRSRKEVRRCWNCSLTSTPTWQKGPHGQDLCESCSRYYLQYRRMKPFDSPTPSLEDAHDVEDSEVEPSSHDLLSLYKTPRQDVPPGSPAAYPTHQSEEDVQIVYDSEPISDTHQSMDSPDSSPAVSVAEHQHLSQGHHSPSHLTQPQPINHSEGQLFDGPMSQNDPPDLDRQSLEPQSQRTLLVGRNNLKTRRLRRRGQEKVTQKALHGTAPNMIKSRYSANTTRILLNAKDPTKPKFTHFSLEEDLLIIQLREQEKLSWEQMKSYLPGREGRALRGRYSRELRHPNHPSREVLQLREQGTASAESSEETSPAGDLPWNEGQDELLLELREDQELEWEEIANLLPGRSIRAVERRYAALTEPGTETDDQNSPSASRPKAIAKSVRRTHEPDPRSSAPHSLPFSESTSLFPATEAIDDTLRARSMGHNAPTETPFPAHSLHSQHFEPPTVTPDSAPQPETRASQRHEDPLNAALLDPDSKFGKRLPRFTVEEDALLLQLREVDGLEWHEILRSFRGRDERSLKNRYKKYLAPRTSNKIPPPSDSENDSDASDVPKQPLLATQSPSTNRSQQDHNLSPVMAVTPGQTNPFNQSPPVSAPTHTTTSPVPVPVLRMSAYEGTNNTFKRPSYHDRQMGSSRPRNRLLRRALDNSQRQRSDLGSASKMDSSSRDRPSLASSEHNVGSADPSQQLHQEMEHSMRTSRDSPPLNAQSILQTQAGTVSVSQSTQSFSSPTDASTESEVQEKRAELFRRMEEIHETNPFDPRLKLLLAVNPHSFSNSTEVLRTFENILNSQQQHGAESQAAHIPEQQRAQNTDQQSPTRERSSTRVPQVSSEDLKVIFYTPPANSIATRLPLSNNEELPAEKVSPAQLQELGHGSQTPTQSQPISSSEASAKTSVQHQKVDDMNAITLGSDSIAVRPRRRCVDNTRGKYFEVLKLDSLDIEDSSRQDSREEGSGQEVSDDSGVPRDKVSRLRDKVRDVFKKLGSGPQRLSDVYTALDTDHDIRGPEWERKVRSLLSSSREFKRSVEGKRSSWELAGSKDGRNLNQPCEPDAERSTLATEVNRSDAQDKNRSNLELTPSKKKRKPRGRPQGMLVATAQTWTEDPFISEQPAQNSHPITNDGGEDELYRNSTPSPKPGKASKQKEAAQDVAVRYSLRSSDISRDAVSSDSQTKDRNQSQQQEQRRRMPRAHSSSSLFVKPHTPASSFAKKRATPASQPSLALLPQTDSDMSTDAVSRVANARGPETPASMHATEMISRPSSVASSARVRFSNGRRYVETPMREVDSDEDELA